MLKKWVGATLLAALFATPAAAQDKPTPGVEDVAPGVRVIHGDQVPSIGVDSAALEALITDKKSLRAVSKQLGGGGVTSIGPAGTTLHMYKAHDTVTGKDLVVILFVRGDAIVDHLIE